MQANNFSYFLTPIAKIDIEQTLDYIFNNLNNAKAANDLLNKILDAIDQICKFPYAQSSCINYLIDNENFRRIFIDNYVLIYEIKADTNSIIILRFKYAKMDLANGQLESPNE